MAADLGALELTRTSRIAEPHGEHDQRALDDHEDHPGDAEQEPMEVLDATGLRRFDRRGDAAVSREDRAGDRQGEHKEAQGGEGKLPAHRRRHSMRAP